MITPPLHSLSRMPLAAVMSGLLAASCAPTHSTPQLIQSNTPSVTYRYSADQELVQANQSAASYCYQYQATPRTKTFSTEMDGSKTVVFECVRVATAPPPSPSPVPYNPTQVYSVRSDQELIDASRNAQSYCQSNGAQQVSSTISTVSNGIRTATFQCLPR
ncbi:hypothetical protein [Magnetospirillum molischianum]|uniref:Secreted protein n=1 Tax=Magnetospirillum molischianum DSM 120 TaxID=1150626 RepID=H8FSV4_MAGML|nr:hypothetical protein [Magnetospirillum molischianum]CCG41442.1 Secreted protein [Magnetospirillum molischianum DSM 120]